jgi:cellulose 1,4-beta-cellobiosidase
MGAQDFYGPGLTVDTTKPFTVVTQFFTNDNTSTGTLSEIRRLYVQNGTVISNAALTTPGIDPGNSITDAFCTQQKEAFSSPDAFAARGGLEVIGGALGRGMVLALSIWDDSSSGMVWLDSTDPTNATASTPGAARGPCTIDSGDTAMLTSMYPDAAVVFSNIKSGEIGSTF